MSIFKAISNLFSSKTAASEQPMSELELGNALAKRELEAAQARLKAKRLAVEAGNKEVLKNVEGEAEAKELARKLTATFEQMKQMDKAKRRVEKRIVEAKKAWEKQVDSNYDLITKLKEDYANSLLDLDEEEEEYQAPVASRRWRTEAPEPTYIPLTPPASAVPDPVVAPVAPPRGVIETTLAVQSEAPEESVETPRKVRQINERGTNPNVGEVPPVYKG